MELALKQDLEELINEGLEILEEAEEAETNEDWSVAIYKYQKAAEILSKCKLPKEKIDMIYDRITELYKIDEYYKQQTLQKVEEIDPSKLQDQAFKLIDQSKQFEKSCEYQKAIDCLLQAVDMLYDAGWELQQLMSFKDEIDRLKKCLQQSSMPNIPPTTTSATTIPQPPTTDSQIKTQENIQPAFNPSLASSIPSQTNFQPPASQFSQNIPQQQMQSMKKLQDQAFKLIDKAKELERKMQYPDAIESLMQAVQLLLQAGWNEEQLTGFQGKIEKIQQKMVRSKQPTTPKTTTIEGLRTDLPTFAQLPQQDVVPQISTQSHPQQSSIKKQEYIPTFAQLQQGISIEELEKRNKQTISEIEQKRKVIQQKQNKAFKLLDEANKLKKMNNYEGSIKIYKQVVDIFNEIGWQHEANQVLETINKLQNQIANLERKKQQEILFKISKQKEVLEGINGKIEGEIVSPTYETSGLSSSSLKQFEEKQKLIREKEEEAFKLLDDAKKKVEMNRFDDAIADYNQAINIFNEIGWNDYVPKIHDTIQKVLSKKEAFSATLQQVSKGKVALTTKERRVIEQIQKSTMVKSTPVIESAQLDKQKQKEVWIQNQALKYIAEAQDFAASSEFDKALTRYNQAIELLIRIGWHDQINQLRGVITEVKKQKEVFEFNKQKQLIGQIERESQGRQLMQQFAEKQKLEEKERKEALRKQRLAEYEERKRKEKEIYNKALKLIEEAEKIKKTTVSDYEKAIAKYKEAQQLLLHISWASESRIVQEMIQNLIEEKNRKQKEQILRAKQREQLRQQQKELEENMKKQMEAYERAKQEQLKRLQKFQQEQAYRKEIENKAFELLEEAEELMKQQAYMDAAELYQKSIENFKKIGWDSQIKYIEEQMNKLYVLQMQFKKEYQLNRELKQKQLEEILEKRRQHEKKKKEELSKLFEIKDMIRAIDKRKKQVQFPKEQLTKETLPASAGFSMKMKRVSIKDSLLSSIELRRKEFQEKKAKMKGNLEDFKKMIREAAKKSKEKQQK